MATTNDPMRSLRQSGPRRDHAEEGTPARRPGEDDRRASSDAGSEPGLRDEEIGRSSLDRGGSESGRAGSNNPGS